ncbi:ribosome biogenesis protein YTM1 [Coprinopsis sp. MPI-PUGE-AT-0042]|nr:ribosome biogenesis protein YTM1 [Coprinopsis sp. MPI-PUGE-AT-0042]
MDTSISNQAVVFTTQTPYPLPSQKYMIPTTWRRYHLSQLVNKALGLAKPVPFDFLVKGEILRTTIAEWCAEKGVGEEETLEIEYIESVLPPQRLSEFPHESWVSGVSCQLSSHFLTAAYDGYLRAFDLSQNVVLDAPIHSAPITSLSLISSSSDDTHTIATSSHDHTGAITSISLDPMSSKSTTLATLHLHTAPLSSISANASGTHLLTASWDGLIGLWDTSIPPSHEVSDSSTTASTLDSSRSKKRRKVTTTEDDATTTITAETKRKAPLNVLKSHLSRVSKATWIDTTTTKTAAISCSFDSTVRTWDVENGLCTRTISCSEKPFLDLAVSANGNTVLAVSSDRTMTMFDLREGFEGVSAAVASFVHPATPSCLAIPAGGKGGGQGESENQVVTGAYDGVVRVWDVRSTKAAISTFRAWDGTKKILSVDWTRGMVGIGGEGGLDVWKVGVADASSSASSMATPKTISA